jgi:hypothetical protein
MDYLFQDGGKPKAKKSKTGTKTTKSKTATKTTKSKSSTKTGTKSSTKTKTGTKKTGSKKGGNFLGAVGDLVAPTGWGPFATAAGLLALDRADAALRRGKSTKSSAKKGGMRGGISLPDDIDIETRRLYLVGAHIKNHNRESMNYMKDFGGEFNPAIYKLIKEIYRKYATKYNRKYANETNYNSPERKNKWDQIIKPIYDRIKEIDKKDYQPENQDNMEKIILYLIDTEFGGILGSVKKYLQKIEMSNRSYGTLFTLK